MFGIKRLIFVLSIDKSQLSESIKSQYGNINANSYLKRFIDLEYNLTNSNLDNFCDFMYLKFDLENLLESKGIEKEQNNNFRFLGFEHEGKLIILTNAFKKKDQKTPKNEIELAQNDESEARKAAIEHEIGDVLFSLCQLSRWNGLRAEDCLKVACERFTKRFEHMEKAAGDRRLNEIELSEYDDLWNAAKKAE